MTRVHIEFQRLQTWLFSVPRLRTMVGANALLGETLRTKLYELARRDGSAWKLQPIAAEKFPVKNLEDPLHEHDNPQEDAKLGISARDGGHFEAEFQQGEYEFIREATNLLHRELPGVRFRIKVDQKDRSSPNAPIISPDLPHFQRCVWTGNGLASVGIKQGKDRPIVSLEVSRRHHAAKRAESGTANDIVTQLLGKTNLRPSASPSKNLRPKTFESLAGNGYMAVIHADGNGVGTNAPKQDPERAAFHHRNRVLLRRALKAAIDATCSAGEKAPLIPLMVGGDDLLVVAKASVAFKFVVRLCEKLEELQTNDADPFHLTLGIGIVFARYTIPFHRLHEVAENLASSAKRKYRGMVLSGARTHSVIDWAVYTTAWVDDPQEIRARDWLRRKGDECRVLSQRPLVVLGKTNDSLQGLWENAAKLKKAEAPRSQLHHLVAQLGHGKSLAELALAEASTDARESLFKAGIGQIWQSGADGLVTSLLDLVEVFEINNYGTKAQAQEEVDEDEDEEVSEDAEIATPENRS